MKIVIHAGQVLEDGRKAATFIWPEEWGDLAVPCEIKAIKFTKVGASPQRTGGDDA